MSGGFIRHHYFYTLMIQTRHAIQIFETLICVIYLSMAHTTAQSQTITQTVRGNVRDAVTQKALSMANVQLIGTAELQATSDEAGNFSLDATTGRYKIKISFTGYESYHDELLVVSGRQTVLNITLQQSNRVLETIEVQSTTVVDELPGLQSITIEKTMRMPANFFDPVRALTSYAGVVAVNDQANSIIVRGNSPNGLLWRLNGVDIVNPNHLANAGTFSDRPAASGGGVNILSSQMLDRTDFYGGAIPSTYGNVTAGVLDMKLREGNKVKDEYTMQASLIGIDLAAEGPFNKETKTSSYAANYRYSTVGLLGALGITFGDEEISFQDLSFATDFEFRNSASLSVFGFGGISRNRFDQKVETEWEEDKDRYSIDFDAVTYATGFNYSTPMSSGRLNIDAAYSSSTQDRSGKISPEVSPFENLLLSDDYESNNDILSVNLGYTVSTNSLGVMKVGVMGNYYTQDLYLDRKFGCVSCEEIETRVHVKDIFNTALFQPYINFQKKLSDAVSIEAGVRYLFQSYNEYSAVDPRISLSLTPRSTSGFNLSYSLLSQSQHPNTLLSRRCIDGDCLTPISNDHLEMTRSHHVDANYYQHLSDNLKIRTGVFYQSLFNVPVTLEPSSFSALNVMDEIVSGTLVNNGTGENYGVDVNLEKYFFSSSYMLVAGSYYESKYVGSDDIKRDTRFNGNYTFSAVYGKEWLKKSKMKTIGLNTRLLYLGGMRQSTINNFLSDESAETIYDDSDPFNRKLGDYFRVDLRLSFRKDKPTHTRTFAIDIQNLLNTQNEAYQYYDTFQDKVVMKYQLGIIPVIVYRIDF
jgi:hypothetical protein